MIRVAVGVVFGFVGNGVVVEDLRCESDDFVSDLI